MALYEQLSVPYQRFSSFPTNSMANSTSSSQDGGDQTRTIFSPFHSAPTVAKHGLSPHLHERLYSRCSSIGANVNTIGTNLASRPMKPTTSQNLNANRSLFQPNGFSHFKYSSFKNPRDKDDFRVPIFTEPNTDNEEVSTRSLKSSSHLKTTAEKHLKRTTSTDFKSRQCLGNQIEKNLNESQTNKLYEPVKQANVSVNEEKRSSLVDDLKSRQRLGNQSEMNPNRSQTNQDQDPKPASKFSNGDKISEVCVNPEKRSNLVNDLKRSNDSNKRLHQESRALPENEVLRDNYRSPHRFENDSECCGDQEHGSLQVANLERNGDVPNTALVDSISGFDVSPDDVVGVLGQKQFWKARRAIVHQQRVFNVQVFELHRLIKVQRLIAGSPNVLLEDSIYLGKSSIKVSPLKKMSSEFVLEPPPIIVKPKEDFLRPSAPPRSSQPPYFFHPPPGNQWLIPVMSPSEGLIYKPHNGSCPPNSGFMTPLYGNYPPMSPNPLVGDFMNMGYSFQPSHPQGFGFPPGNPPPGPTFFPPYAMPSVYPSISNSSVDQMTPFARFGLNGSENQISGDVSSQKRGVISFCVGKFQGTKESEVQGSTASSPPEKVKEKVLSLLPTAPLSQSSDEPSGTHTNEQ